MSVPSALMPACRVRILRVMELQTRRILSGWLRSPQGRVKLGLLVNFNVELIKDGITRIVNGL